jgi:hypothetical protein
LKEKRINEWETNVNHIIIKPKKHIGNVGNGCSYGTFGKYDKQKETNDRQRSDKNIQGLKAIV